MNFTAPLLKTWTHAFVLSFSAVNFFVVALGVGIVPYKADDIWQESTQSITHCYLHNRGELAISAVWTHNFSGRVDRLVMFSLNDDSPRMQNPWPTLQPNAMTGDGQRGLVFVGNADGSVYSVNPNRLREPPIFIGRHPGAHVLHMACSANGRWLLTVHDDSLYVWDLAVKKLHVVWAGGQVQCVAVLPDSKSGICGLNDGSVVEIDLARNLLVRKVAKHTSPIVAVEVCPHGRQIAALCFTGHLQVVETATGQVIWERVQGWCPPVLAFSENGQFVVSAGKVERDYGLIMYQADSGNRVATMSSLGTDIRGVTFNGNHAVVAWGADGTLHVWSPECLRNPVVHSTDRVIVPQWEDLNRHKRNVRSLVRS